MAIDINPTLPENIVKIIMSLPKRERDGVIPNESPTVPNAEKLSNIREMKLGSCDEWPRCSVIVRRKMHVKRMRNALIVNMEALDRTADGIFLFKTHISSWTSRSLMMSMITRKTVVIFIPPAIDPEDPPMNISGRVISLDGKLRDC